MHSVDVIKWVGAWGPLVNLASTVLLAAITGWLAYLTKVMADSARTAADHSRTAAEASLSSVAAAEASIDVRFDMHPQMGTTVGLMTAALKELVGGGELNGTEEVTPDVLAKVTAWRTIDLTCRGATVSVHGLKLTEVSLEDKAEDFTPRGGTRMLVGTSYDLELPTSERLPRVCHAGETIHFDVPDRPVDERLFQFSALVLYAIGSGPIREREVKWRHS